MSPASRARLREHAVNAALTATATLFLTFGSGLWHSKESVSAHNADMQRINGKLERLLDVVCYGRDPKPRQCTEPEPASAGEVQLP